MGNTMKAVILLSLVALTLGKETLVQRFTEFKQKYEKKYSGLDEELKRFNIFKSNVESIELHNSRGSSYSRGINKFTDLTAEEFKSTFLGLKQLPSSSAPRSAPSRSPPVHPIHCPVEAPEDAEVQSLSLVLTI